MEGIEVFEGTGGTVIADARYAPLYIATWYDQPAEDVIRPFFAWNLRIVEQALRDGGYVLITDSTRSERPAPVERRLIAELTEAMPPEGTERCLGSYVVVDNPLIRGALTAMQWLGANPWNFISVKTCAEAIRRGLENMAEAGMPLPSDLDPDRYEAPPRP